jgi:hypothetical protein
MNNIDRELYFENLSILIPGNPSVKLNHCRKGSDRDSLNEFASGGKRVLDFEDYSERTILFYCKLPNTSFPAFFHVVDLKRLESFI